MTANAVPLMEDDTVRIASIIFGDIDVYSASIMTFDDGLHGFEAHKQFALLPAAREGVFWLQSLAHRDVAFLLADPFMCAPGYELDISATDRLALGLASPDDVLVLAIVTVPTEAGELPTANLRGPLLFSMSQRRGRQVVTSNESHQVRAPIDILALPERREAA